MTDDRMEWDEGPLDETLREAAARYHEAGAVPRDAMWARIEAARRGPRLVVAGDEPEHRRAPDVVPLAAPRRLDRRWMRWAAGAGTLAATLLVGVAIGRSSGGGAGDSILVAPRTVADAPPAAAGPVAGDAGVAPADPAGISGRAPVVAGPVRGDAPPAPAGRLMPPGSDAAAALMPYQLAAVQHMSRAEALLTTFRAGARSGAVDDAVQPWARDLLSSTRLLIDSPAGDDPALRVLLGDLELVLAQIVQLPAQRRAEEMQLIDRQLDADGVITRLRTAVPAGTPARGA